MLVPVFIIAAIVFILSQALIIGANRSIDDVNQIDSVAAFHLAETGLENAAARLLGSAEINPGDVSGTCAALATEPAVALGRGSFVFETPASASSVCTSSNLECLTRVRGVVNRAERVLERTTCIRADLGDAGFGGTPPNPINMSIKNTLGVAGIAVFNLAWRIQGSEGQNTVGGASDATCTNCIATNNPLWTLPSNTGNVATGSMGSAISVPAGQSVSIAQKVEAKVSGQTTTVDRNYVQVGIVLPGSASSSVTVIGSYSKSGSNDSTTNNSATSTTYGFLPHFSTNNNWCKDADTLVLGISGSVTTLGKDATFASITFDSVTQKKVLGTEVGYKARFPEATTSDAAGDLVSEIYVLYNPAATLVGVSSSGNVIKVQSTTGLVNGTVLRVSSGTGALAANTKVIGINSSSNEVTVDKAPTTAIGANAAICGGICAFFDPNVGAFTQFAVVTNNTSTTGQITQWAAGAACFRGVDGSKIRPVRKAIPSFKNWREVN